MDNILFIASTIFIYISYGCACQCAKKEFGPYEVMDGIAGLIYKLIIILTSILPVISLTHIYSLKWYWLFMINLLVMYPLGYVLSIVYTSIFGCKTKYQYNYVEDKMMKSHMYSADMIITSMIGVVLFILAFII